METASPGVPRMQIRRARRRTPPRVTTPREQNGTHECDRTERGGQDLRPRPGARRSRPRGRAGRGARLPRAQRRRASPRRSGCCSACSAPTAARRPCSAGTRGARRPSCTAGSPTSPATSTCGPTSPAARSSTCSARMRGGLDEKKRAELLERFELDPSQEGPHLLQGQPAEGRPGRGARRPTPSCCCSTSPPPGSTRCMEAEFQRCIREVKAQGATVLLSSHILAEVEALCDRVSIIRAGRDRAERHAAASCATSPGPRSSPRRSARPARSPRLTGVHGIEHARRRTHHRAAFDVDTDHLDAAIEVLGERRASAR